MRFKRQYIDLRGTRIWSSHAQSLLTPIYKFVYKLAGRSHGVALLLHGGMSQSEGFDGRLSPSVKGFEVFSYDRAGHGRTPDVPGSFHFDFQYQEAVAYLEDVVKRPANLIGYSDGAIITLLVAINRPDLVKTITLIGANYKADMGQPSIEEWEPNEEAKAKYARFSPDPPHTLVAKIKKMVQIWRTEPNMSLEQLAKIKCPTLIIAGDDDVMSLAHTNEIYEAIENSRLAIIPASSHLIDKDQPELLNKVIRDFLLNPEFPVTLMPVRRKAREAQ